MPYTWHMTASTENHVLDTTGLKCPLPVLKARKALKGLPDGAIVEVVTTDPGAPADFRHFCTESGHRLVEQRQRDDGADVSVIEKASG